MIYEALHPDAVPRQPPDHSARPTLSLRSRSSYVFIVSEPRRHAHTRMLIKSRPLLPSLRGLERSTRIGLPISLCRLFQLTNSELALALALNLSIIITRCVLI
jgi:hypothetical protein